MTSLLLLTGEGVRKQPKSFRRYLWMALNAHKTIGCAMFISIYVYTWKTNLKKRNNTLKQIGIDKKKN